MKAIENGVFGVTKLINKSKGGPAVMNINQISELDQYQEAALRTWNTNNDFWSTCFKCSIRAYGKSWSWLGS